MKALTLAVVAALYLHATAAAQTVDQSYTAAPTFGSNIDSAGTPGQSFTPTGTSLDFVRLNLRDATNNALGATFQVRVHQGAGFAGTVLGTSTATVLPNGFGFGAQFEGAVAQFDFASAVALTAGNTYTLELQKVSGDTFFVYGVQPGGYAGGTAYFNSQAPTSDLYFVEGFTPVPEPAGVLLACGVVGTVAAGRRRRGRSRLAGG